MKSVKPENKPRHRVLLADPDAAFAHRLARIFEGRCSFRLCGHVLDSATALVAIQTDPPDLVLANAELDPVGEFPLLRSLAAKIPAPPVLAVTDHCDPAEVEKVLLAGARGLLLKSESPEEILSALRAVANGQVYVSRSVAMPLLRRLLNEPAGSTPGGVETLTDREFRIFELLGHGLTTREVAARLGLSCKTVDSHRAKIQHRLGVDSAAALAQRAYAWVQLGFRPAPPAASEAAVVKRSDQKGRTP